LENIGTVLAIFIKGICTLKNFKDLRFANLDHATQASDSPGHLDRARKETRRHRHQLDDAIGKYSCEGFLRKKKQHAQISLKNAKSLNYMNPYSADYWRQYLINAYDELIGTPNPCFSVTGIHLPFMTDDVNWNLRIPAFKQFLWNTFMPHNFLGMIEFARFQNVKYGDGKLISPHFQGVLWGGFSRGDWDRIHKAFAGGPMGAAGLVCKEVYDLKGGLSYAVKLPSYGHNLWKSGQGFVSKPSRQYLPQHYALFKHLSGFTFPELTVAGGQGKEVRRAATEAAMRRVPKRHHLTTPAFRGVRLPSSSASGKEEY
jgi:hypothetical protein